MAQKHEHPFHHFCRVFGLEWQDSMEFVIGTDFQSRILCSISSIPNWNEDNMKLSWVGSSLEIIVRVTHEESSEGYHRDSPVSDIRILDTLNIIDLASIPWPTNWSEMGTLLKRDDVAMGIIDLFLEMGGQKPLRYSLILVPVHPRP